jgi:hypothetical protein
MLKITYNYEKRHDLVYQGGLVMVKPALGSGSRLYVIQNDSTDFKIYVGTALHLDDRFDPRVTACRELGFSQIQMDPVWIFAVQVLIDDKPAPPGDKGISSGGGWDIDVEWLLIRTYLQELKLSVRNINKIGPFYNGTGGPILWDLVDNAALGFGRHAYKLNSGYYL